MISLANLAPYTALEPPPADAPEQAIARKNGWLENEGTEYDPGVTDEVPLYETHDGGTSWTPVDLGGAFVKGICSIDIVQTKHINQSVSRRAGTVGTKRLVS